jgi:hypothetical protein
MSVAKVGGYPIPYVYAIVIDREMVGDEARTAGGKLRRDIVAVKRTWRLQTRPMKKNEADTILGVLQAVSYGVVDFWLDDFGAEENSIPAYVDVESEERVQFGRDGVWHSDGRRLTLKISEV